MNKKEYLDMLKDYLIRYYSEEESLEIVRDYEEYFVNGNLDGKTDIEIIGELGSPKKLAEEFVSEDDDKEKKNSLLNNIKIKFDEFFEKSIYKEKSYVENMKEQNSKFLDRFTSISPLLKLLILGFISYGFFIMGFLYLAFLFEMIGLSVISVDLLYKNRGKSKNIVEIKNLIKITTAVNIALIFIFLIITLDWMMRLIYIIDLGMIFSILMFFWNLFIYFVCFKNSASTVFSGTLLAFFTLMNIPIVLGLIALTIAGVVSAIVLTPVTLSALKVLEMNFMWIAFPIILAFGLFIMMYIIIKHYILALYKLCLYYVNWSKRKQMYLNAYTNASINENIQVEDTNKNEKETDENMEVQDEK